MKTIRISLIVLLLMSCISMAQTDQLKIGRPAPAIELPRSDGENQSLAALRGQVVLIDVDVYQQSNVNIMRQEGLQMIPTLVFYDRQGQRVVQVGVLQPDQLRAVLRAISGAT